MVNAGNTAAKSCGRFFVLALAALFLNAAKAAGQPADSSRLDARFAVTLSESCLISSLRLPDLYRIASINAAPCRSEAVVLAREKAELYVGTTEGALFKLSLPSLSVRQKIQLEGRVVRIFVPQTAPYLIAEVALQDMSSELMVMDIATWSVLRRLTLQDRQGNRQVLLHMIESPSRKSLLLSFEKVSELWELFMGADAPAVFEGLVHDYRLGEGIREPELLPVRRIRLDAPIVEFVAEPDSPHLLIRHGDRLGRTKVSRFNLDVRRAVSARQIEVPPDLSPATHFGTGTLRIGSHALQISEQIALAGESCRASTRIGIGRVALWSCTGEDAGRLFVVDLAAGKLTAILEPDAGNSIQDVAADRESMFLLAIANRDKLLLYRTGNWCRLDVLAATHVSKVWAYP
ncbi:MAG: hypothetical protein JNN20_18070 [Betaproteobacteria bacterium]|nr:hypothetical protein [Betaproteobacteria bacterium]